MFRHFLLHPITSVSLKANKKANFGMRYASAVAFNDLREKANRAPLRPEVALDDNDAVFIFTDVKRKYGDSGRVVGHEVIFTAKVMSFRPCDKGSSLIFPKSERDGGRRAINIDHRAFRFLLAMLDDIKADVAFITKKFHDHGSKATLARCEICQFC